MNQNQSALEVDAQYSHIHHHTWGPELVFLFGFGQGADGFEASVDSLAFFWTRS